MKSKSKKYTYEDEKRDALNNYLAIRPKLKEIYIAKQHDIKLASIKTDLQVIARNSIIRFRLKCNKIIKECFGA